ncbi:MAG: methyltransferase domain-containing protein [Bacteroidetes bacterium]|jgi:2-polyprenyl-3-methyl-5-hydroxy-6-metoxy-1,4-benzoquinol methylase|nr:methyltransferase domain-containing protein [Bacteroidota bacterium]MDF1864692.1 methyltransferase domain-containing protein [Saprospiraceae bacterium]
MSNYNTYFETNKALWDAKTPLHLKSKMYDLEAFKSGKNMLEPIVLEGIGGEVEGKTILHLQCHFGQDSMSFSRMGAKVIGIDLSPEGIRTAKELNKELNLNAQFVVSNVYDLKDNLEGQFDIVFTSYGAITWLPDLNKWASIINHFLKPGGTFYIAEFHPVFYTFNFENWQIEYPYFNTQVFEEEEVGTYADRDAPIQLKEYFWCHSLEEVIQPLLNEGLQLTQIKEYDYTPWDCFPNLKERAKGEFVIDGLDVKLPYVFSLKMKKPL